MTHFNDDELLEYALGIFTDDSRRAEIEAHMAVCPDCRIRLEEIRKDIEIIGSVRPLRTDLKIPAKRTYRGFIYRSLRTAALVIFGIATGLGVSRWIDQRPALVQPAYMTLAPPPDSVSGFVAADVTGIASSHYREMLGERE